MKRFIAGLALIAVAATVILSNQDPTQTGTQSPAVVSSAPTAVGMAKAPTPPKSPAGKPAAQIHLSKPMQEFQALRSKSLRTAREERQIQESLSEPRLIEEAGTLLQARSVKDLDLDEQDVRLQALDFLSDALNWKGNPSLRQAMSVAEAALDRVDTEARAPLMKRSLTGDRIELFHALLRADRTRAIEIYERLEGRPEQLPLAFAMTRAFKGAKNP
jgi:hypothetical protein